MKSDYTTNSRYITHTIAFWKVGRIHFFSSGVKGLMRGLQGSTKTVAGSLGLVDFISHLPDGLASAVEPFHGSSSGRMLFFSATCTYGPGFCWAVHNNLLHQNCWVVIGAGRCLGNTVGGHPNQVCCQSNAWVHEGDNFETMTRFRFLFTAIDRWMDL